MPQDQDDIKGADAMKQAPTPGPLSVGQEETIAFNLCAVHGFNPDFVKTQRDFALAVIREYEVVSRPRPAPVASGGQHSSGEGSK